MANANNSLRKHLNVDSPSFTPLQPSENGLKPGPALRSASISPKAASAAVFTPQSTKAATFTPSVQQSRDPSGEWQPQQDFQEFVPQNFEVPQIQEPQLQQGLLNAYDPYAVQSAVAGISNGQSTQQINPYAQDASALANTQFFHGNTGYQQPLQYHLYAPSGPAKQNLLDYQRNVYDFFIPEDLREELNRKSEATHQSLPQSTLPTQVDVFHSLVPLDTNHQRNATLFGYPSWLYKAVSSKDGHTYALRRLEGYRLTDERAVQALHHWNRIRNGNVVSVHNVITTRAFGDSSLIFVTDYHPLSKTLAEQYFQTPNRFQGARGQPGSIPESEMWSYIVQIASALKAIHTERLAARTITPTKVIITSKRRVRLSACGVLDVVHYSSGQQAHDLQQEDLVQFGQLILALASNNPNPMQSYQKSIETLGRSHYTARLRECVQWLLTPAPAATPVSPSGPGGAQAPMTKNVDIFLAEIAGQIVLGFDESLHASDTLTSVLSREIENGRFVRLLTKLNMINERPDIYGSSNNSHDSQWAETGDRYYLKLFRDYVFHQVDAQGRPVTDLAWVIGCLNKLDAGSEERIVLVSRDEQSVLVVSYREVRRGLDGAWQELMKAQGRR